MYCPHCGKKYIPGANFCSACGQAPAFQQTPCPQPRIVRPRHPRFIAGVLSGFALYYGWDLALTRILFAVLTVFTFPICVIVYVAAWIILPDAQFTLPQNIYVPQPPGPTSTPTS